MTLLADEATRNAAQGSAVKILNEEMGLVGGWGIPFGGPVKDKNHSAGRDLDGEFFDETTNFQFDWFPNEGRPALYDHGTDPDVKLATIGRQVSKFVDPQRGVWVETQLNLANQYAKYVLELAKKGVLAYSSGALGGYVRREATGKITQWPWVEQTMTVRPANPYAAIAADAVKHLREAGALPPELEPTPASLAEALKATKALDEANGDALLPGGYGAHPTTTGTHTHAHAAYAKPTDVASIHSHEHTHDGTDGHQHDHSAAKHVIPMELVDGKAVWSSSYVNDLPDSAFAWIEDGGTKTDGKTDSAHRHLPHHDADGTADKTHVDNAVARFPQTKGAPESALTHLENHQKALGEDVAGKKLTLPDGMSLDDLRSKLEDEIEELVNENAGVTKEQEAYVVDVRDGFVIASIGDDWDDYYRFAFTINADGTVDVTGPGEEVTRDTTWTVDTEDEGKSRKAGRTMSARNLGQLHQSIKAMGDLHGATCDMGEDCPMGDGGGSTSKAIDGDPNETPEKRAQRREIDALLAGIDLDKYGRG